MIYNQLLPWQPHWISLEALLLVLNLETAKEMKGRSYSRMSRDQINVMLKKKALHILWVRKIFFSNNVKMQVKQKKKKAPFLQWIRKSCTAGDYKMKADPSEICS